MNDKNNIIEIGLYVIRQERRKAQLFAKHAKRNQAIEMCKKIGLHWKANDRTIKIVEWDETFTHSQTNELIRRLNSLDAY